MDWLRDHLWETWLALTIVLGVAEMFSLDLVLGMLAIGTAAAMIAALVGAPELVQVLLAAGVATAMLALARPQLAQRLHSGPDLVLGHSKLVGRRAEVTAAITGTTTGRIRVDGETWSAAPYDEDLSIAAGEMVEVLQIRGATAYVHPIPRLEP